MWNNCIIALGSNQGDKIKFLTQAHQSIKCNVGNIIDTSFIYESEPLGFNSQNWFYNQVIKVQTKFSAKEVLEKLLEIEDLYGRVRVISGEYISRTLDLDIISFNAEIINTKNLVIPHPEMCKRKFVLFPLYDIDEDFVHPISKKNIKILIDECQDFSRIKRTDIKILI